MKLSWNLMIALGAVSCVTFLSGCGGETTAESSASTPAEKPAETSTPADSGEAAPEPGSAEDFIAKGNQKIEEAAQVFQNAQQEFFQSLQGMMGEAKSEEEAQALMTSEDGKAKMAEAQKKLENVQTEIQKQAEEALKFYTQAVEKKPENPEGYIGQAMAYDMLRKKEEAMAAIAQGTQLLKKQVLTGEPDKERVMELVQILALQQKIDEAESVLQELQSKYPENADLQELTKGLLAEIANFKQQAPAPGAPGAPAPAPEGEAKDEKK